MIVVVYEQSTGVARSFSSQEPSSLDETLAYYVLDVPYHTLSQYRWDMDTRTLEAKTPVARTVLTSDEMRARIGTAAWAHLASSERTTVKHAVAVLSAAQVDLTSALVQQSLHEAVMEQVRHGLPAGRIFPTLDAWRAPVMEEAS